MNGLYVGLDIGGTKCAIVIGEAADDLPKLLFKYSFPTPATQEEAMETFCSVALAECKGRQILGIGISAGNPMDAAQGMLLNPPNLPNWSGLSLTQWAARKLKAPSVMENDANACALAEWRWGAGKGYHNMVFLTFGTGMGAGLILKDRLYRGATGNAGEVGHWRLSDFGPVGYGKQGSLEGFCSGGGIAQLAKSIGLSYVQRGQTPSYWDNGTITAKTVADAARLGDAAALETYALCGHMLGKGLALMVDIINPDCIVIGSIYPRCEDLFQHTIIDSLRSEALGDSAAACAILPAKLGEQIGDYAALSLAIAAAKQ